jgi:hypothetical protein
MPRFQIPTAIIVTFLAGGAGGNVAFAQASSPSLEQSIAAAYPVGSTLTVQAGDILGVNFACKVVGDSSFKDGQLHPPGLVQKSVLTAASCITRPLTLGGNVGVILATVISKTNRIEFLVAECTVTCVGNYQNSYKAQVSFEFPKGFLAKADFATVQDAIRHVFGGGSSPAQVAPSTVAAPAAVQPAVTQAPVPTPAVQLTTPATYVNSQSTTDRLQLNKDGSFALTEGGQSFSGTFAIAGANLKLHIVELQKDVDIAIQDKQLIVNGNEVWVPAAK